MPRCETVFRLKLDRKDFENHILRPVEPENVDNHFISFNNKVLGIRNVFAGCLEEYKLI